MCLPPEIIFHRFFQTLRRPDREIYRGKADLDRLVNVAVPVSMLAALQEMLNAALLEENVEIPGHVEHDRFHFDYIDSLEPNALAFCREGYSFIGVTIPLVEQLWHTATRLSESRATAALLDIQLSDSQAQEMTPPQRIAVVVFRLQLMFVVLHEFTHVVHGHVRTQNEDPAFANEILVENGSLERQVREADADGYAVYFLLANLLDAVQERAHIASVVGMEQKSVAVQDEILLSCFVMSVAAFFFVRLPTALTATNVYNLTHPPQAARMNLVMQAVASWCDQNRPGLREWLTQDRFQVLMRTVASATWGMNGGHDWSQQTAFLRSEAGADYFRRLDEGLTQHVLGLRR